VLAAIPLSLTTLTAQASHPVIHRDFDPDAFDQSTDIDNPYYPLTPGTQLTLKGHDAEGPHRLVVTVTDVVKVIGGVRTLAVSEQDFAGDTLAEDEVAFLAQDTHGNVWRLGEYPEEFDIDSGEFEGAPNTWIAGVAGSRPGVYMRAGPQPGTSSYFQVYAPRLHIRDQGQVVAAGETVCVRAGCFEDVVVVREQNVLEKDDCCQLKYHAPGVGNVRVEAEGDATGEFLELVRFRHLSRAELAEASRRVLRLDRRAYDLAEAVYGATEPAAREG
jgi:hypothetical protein